MITPPTGQVRIEQSHKSGKRAKLFSIILSLLLNGAVFLLLMLISISVFKQEMVELILESGPNESRIENNKKVFQISKKQKPQPANASKAAPVISSVTFTNDAVFAIEDDGALQDFGLGDGWGKVLILDQVKREVVLVFLVQDQLQRGWYSLSMFLHRFLKCNLA